MGYPSMVTCHLIGTLKKSLFVECQCYSQKFFLGTGNLHTSRVLPAGASLVKFFIYLELQQKTDFF